VEEKTQEITTTRTDAVAVNTEHPQKSFEKKKVIFRAHQIIWYILGFVEIMLGFRIALKALGANPESGFTSFIYGLTNPFALPFQGIFRTSVSYGSVFEWSTLVAALVYAVIAYGIVYFIQLMKPVSPKEVNQTVDNT
jgi:YGGT family protein